MKSNATRSVAALVTLMAALGACSSKPNPSTTAFLITEPAATFSLTYDTTSKTIGLEFESTGLLPSAAYRPQLRRGTCLKPGRVVTSFGTITSDSLGTAKATLDGGRIASGIPRGVNVDLLLLAGRSTTSSGCVDIPTATPTKTLRLFPPPTMRTGGSFTASYRDARTLSLRVALLGLKPGSVHAVRVYQGTCSSFGTRAAAFGNLTAGSDGSAAATKVLRLPAGSSNLYVAVSYGSSASIDTSTPNPVNVQLILCGNLPARPSKK